MILEVRPARFFFIAQLCQVKILLQRLLPRHSGLRPQFYILTLTAVNVHSPVFCMGEDLVLLTPSGEKRIYQYIFKILPLGGDTA